MLRNLILLGAVAGIFASIPAIYQRNPQAFDGMLRRVLTEEAPQTQHAAASVKHAPGRAETLLGRKVRIPSDGRGHYSAEFKLNGRTIHAMVDTGATFVAINESTARRIGLKLSQSDFRHRVDTANGTTAAAAGTIGNLQIGRIFVEEVQAVVLKDEALSGTLVGMSFLSRLSRFEMENGALLLEQ
ncbi:TIGR02281 family clan AA aspartic protease [Chelativorans salis]|uniref:TIGR02281 family clan AA aspartic protease n=1 Tax=Chelativorans salis TaxID=2978478 RepID=A0ABT2LP99_9HYPH|nr:TIGR02281 family clan AA aspartic protease [Chelativorans sp. EGI FJ00035]MCT7376126.1 TIGR02281 family clan AA aspartic protease [Chelativorans sp. EGI FJ00035]